MGRTVACVTPAYNAGMSLPILQSTKAAASEADLLRLFLAAQARWAGHLAEPEPLEGAVAFCNPALRDARDANHVRDAQVPEGWTAAQVIDSVDAHFAARGSRCAYWVTNASAPPGRVEPLVGELASRGHAARRCDVMLLERAAGLHDVTAPAGVTVIPARASFRHARQLADEACAERGHPPAVAEGAMLHLDDPHWDALLALKDGRAVARAGVLAVGEVGLVEHVYVAAAHRRQGLGRLMMARVLEICARSLFRQVMLAVAPDDAPAKALYAKLGFRVFGQVTEHAAPFAVTAGTAPG